MKMSDANKNVIKELKDHRANMFGADGYIDKIIDEASR